MSDPLAKKVLLIGWDAADWKVINPLLDAGKMPHLERFVNEGVMGDLATLYPELSPMLWTSIATGKRPMKHGIYGFTEPDPHGGGIRPVSILSRKTKAIWNVLCQSGRKCNVVGWWPSHPAEPIDGVMVSNHYQRAVAPVDKPWPMRPGTVHPARLAEPLAKLRVHPQDLTAEHILPFVPKAGEIDQEKDHRLESIAKIICDCSSIHAAATGIIQLEPWDFMAVYYDAIDHFSHGFMRYHPPREEWVSEKDYEIFKEVVEGGYRYHDMMLGVLLGLAGEDTTVILVSDHGFHPDHLRPRRVPREPAGPAAQHRHYGIVAMKGPGIKKDQRVYGANLLDVCPTILTLFGLPVGRDMDGRPLLDAFEDPPPFETIPSWDDVPGQDGCHPPDLQVDPIEAHEAINQLVDLGYIDQPDEDREKAIARSVRELNYNLARAYMDANRHAEAIELLDDLLGEWPDEYRFGIQLVSCYQAVDRISEARPLLEQIFARKKENAAAAREKLKAFAEEHKDEKPEDLDEKQQAELRNLQGEVSWNPYAMEYLMGSLLFAEGDAENSLIHLQRAERAEPRQPGLHLKIGDVYLKMKRYGDAQRSFEKALEIDPDNAMGHLGLCRCFLPQRRFNLQAADEALTAVGLLYHNPLAHFHLGVALHRLGKIPRAVEALQVAVSQNPNHVAAHRRLAYIFKRRLDDPQKADEHRRLAREAAQRVKDIKANKLAAAGADGKPAAQTPPGGETGQTLASQQVFEPVDLDDTVVVVSGLPRSGTSMMMQLLQTGGMSLVTDGEREADEDNPRGYLETQKTKRLHQDRSWLPECKGKAVKIIAPLLRQLAPELNYRVVFMQRDLNEILASQRRLLKRQDKTGANLSDDRLHEEFARQIRQVYRLLGARKIPTLYVDYREAINRPTEVASRVNAFLGGALDESSMAAAVDPRLYRQRLNNPDQPTNPSAPDV